MKADKTGAAGLKANETKSVKPGNRVVWFLARYKFFILLLTANIIIGLVFPDIGMDSAELAVANLLEMLSVIPPIFILLGLLDVWVDRAVMMRYMGKGSGIKGMLIAVLLGSAAAGPLYAAFPVAGMMIRKGSSLMNVFIFIGAWSTTKIPMLTFEAASMGYVFTLTRLALSLAGIPAIAFITDRLLNARQKTSIYEINKEGPDDLRIKPKS